MEACGCANEGCLWSLINQFVNWPHLLQIPDRRWKRRPSWTWILHDKGWILNVNVDHVVSKSLPVHPHSGHALLGNFLLVLTRLSSLPDTFLTIYALAISMDPWAPFHILSTPREFSIGTHSMEGRGTCHGVAQRCVHLVVQALLKIPQIFLQECIVWTERLRVTMTRTQTLPANLFIRSVSWLLSSGGKGWKVKTFRLQLNQSDWWFHHSNNVRILWRIISTKLILSVRRVSARRRGFPRTVRFWVVNSYMTKVKVYLISPANGQFTVEHAVNRAFTTLSYGGRNTALYGDGQNHPGFGTTLDGKAGPGACISEPNSAL